MDALQAKGYKETGFSPANIGVVNANIFHKKYDSILSDIMETSAGNTGNSYIGSYLIDALSEHQKTKNLQNNVFFDALPKQEELKDIGIIIFSFQDFIKDHLSYVGKIDPFESWINILKETKAIPIVIGIGINASDENSWPKYPLASLIKLLKYIGDNKGLICTRCENTVTYLAEQNIKNAIATGCPSFLLMKTTQETK